MEARVIQFIAALRAEGVRVSLAESADAFLAVDDLGVQDRESFKLSLRATLVKESADLPIFEELFPLFFDSADARSMTDIMEDPKLQNRVKATAYRFEPQFFTSTVYRTTR